MRLRAYSCGDESGDPLEELSPDSKTSKPGKIYGGHRQLEWLIDKFEPRKRNRSLDTHLSTERRKNFGVSLIPVPTDDEIQLVRTGDQVLVHSNADIEGATRNSRQDQAQTPASLLVQQRVMYELNPIPEVDEIFEYKDSKLTQSKKKSPEFYANRTLSPTAKKKQDFDSGEFFKEQYFYFREESERRDRESKNGES